VHVLTLRAQAGANLVLLARRQDALQKVADACTAAHAAAQVGAGGKVATIQLDVGDKAQVAGLLERIPAELRAVDILGARARVCEGR
jgi:3-hydroxy acid dehydrogenase/malonic semialdehyde reductase